MDTGFSLEHLEERDHLEDLDIYLTITTRVILRKLDRDHMAWIHLLQDRDKCEILVNKVMNMRFP